MQRQLTVDNPRDAADAVALMAVEQSARMIRIEGHSMTGKTSLAKHLARVLTGIHVDSDAYYVGGELRQQQLIENLSQYVATGLYVILEGIRLEERVPSAGTPAFRVVVTSDFEEDGDRIRSAEIASELGVDRYFELYRPTEKADVEVVVRVVSEQKNLLAAIKSMTREP